MVRVPGQSVRNVARGTHRPGPEWVSSRHRVGAVLVVDEIGVVGKLGVSRRSRIPYGDHKTERGGT